ncbi:MAG: leucyl aminopeptidase family protein [Rubrivivax sp.]|nr:leucyl aminopeptidase family protein [Rubrivivax sp.]
MTLELLSSRQARSAEAITIHVVDRAAWPAARERLDAASQRWLVACGFDGAPDSHALLPDASGALGCVWAGVRSATDPYALAALPRQLPPATYVLGEAGLVLDEEAAALSWTLGGYVFDLYKPARRPSAALQLPASAASSQGALLGEAIMAVRDLVNTPAEHMGPAELAEAARLLARQHGARFRQIVGDELLKKGFPAIHAVGRAATRAPRLIELNWGSPKHPRLTLVGKGVCFDSGGLDIKPADGMRWMKKDMGGAANTLGLATLVMAMQLPVQLQVLIPAVENAIAGNAYRPGDVIKTRAGLHIEIGNTDAEGRVILCDALAYAVETGPDLLIDLATLTGAARVALGPQLPALFCRRMDLARQLVDRGLALGDPLWHMPLWQPYHASIESDIADIVNTGKGPMAGAITAALFLADFVPESTDWMHIDLFAWNDGSRPGRPAGGEAQTIRALLAMLKERFGS